MNEVKIICGCLNRRKRIEKRKVENKILVVNVVINRERQKVMTS